VKGTILLVEDEDTVRRASRRMLERAGYRVIEAEHAEDATRCWADAVQRNDPIDVLVTDFMMPGQTGLELAAALRAGRPSLPVLVVSGYTGGAQLGDDPQTGTAPIVALRKPFSREELLAHVREARASAEPLGLTPL
jgi:CheY-like chemotaxis protein